MPAAAPPRLSTVDLALAHLLARLALGINIALHGLTRIHDIAGFSRGMQEQFAETILPAGAVFASGYVIVIGEAVVGTLLIAGLFLRQSLVAGMGLMLILVFGTCLIQNWGTASTQLIYVILYAALLATLAFDRYSIDHLRRRGA